MRVFNTDAPVAVQPKLDVLYGGYCALLLRVGGPTLDCCAYECLFHAGSWMKAFFDSIFACDRAKEQCHTLLGKIIQY
jgi:hypothetical protein